MYYVFLLREEPVNLQVYLDCLNDSVGLFGVHFVPSRCEMLLQNWNASKPKFVVAGEDLVRQAD